MEKPSNGYLIKLSDGKADPSTLHVIRDQIRSGLKAANLDQYIVSFDNKTKTLQVFADIEKADLDKILQHSKILWEKKYEVHELKTRQITAEGKKEEINPSDYRTAIYNASLLENTIEGLSQDNSSLLEELEESQNKIKELEIKAKQMSFVSPFEALLYFLKTTQLPKLKEMNSQYELAILEVMETLKGDKIPSISEVVVLMKNSRIPPEKYKNYGELQRKIGEIKREIEEAGEMAKKTKEMAKKFKHLKLDVGIQNIEVQDNNLSSLRKEAEDIKVEYEKLQRYSKIFKSVFKGGELLGFYVVNNLSHEEVKIILPIPEKKEFSPIEELIINYARSSIKNPSQRFANGVLYFYGQEEDFKKIDTSGKKSLRYLGVNFDFNLFSTCTLEEVVEDSKREAKEKEK